MTGVVYLKGTSVGKGKRHIAKLYLIYIKRKRRANHGATKLQSQLIHWPV